ncbi:NIF3-like protein [Phlyctema vagabunda]|uniref:NIF3-like protein n=1 Tax=Phlyctema vagabunda TaxID=108571 RepID=A0ABR4PTW9_9HELO
MILRNLSRNYTMASTTRSSPFTQAVLTAVRKLYPEQLADKSFDNTGLLLEAPHRPNYLRNSVLLTIDLTTAVADEAIKRKDSVVIAYHPIIFRGLKSLTLGNTQQSSLLRLAQEGISVYSPHTAVDAAPGGLNDWLADIIVGQTTQEFDVLEHDRSVITPVEDVFPYTGAGYGRIIKFKSPQTLSSLLSRINSPTGLGSFRGISVAVPQSVRPGSKGDIKISSVGICAGSGGHMLGGLDVDLLFTGEMSHHEALAAIEQGRVLITAFHSNSERGFLKNRMQAALQAKITEEISEELMEADGLDELRNGFEVAVSESDRDPFEIVTSLDGW